MKVKTSTLTGAALDWAVAQCEGPNTRGFNNPIDRPMSYTYRPSTDWGCGGPIIEREKIDTVWHTGAQRWTALADYENGGKLFEECGGSPLEAAMRVYVASRLGAEINLPKGLK